MFEQYQYKRAYFVDLAEMYAIDRLLLGKRFFINRRGVCLTICIPSLIYKGVIPSLGMPGIFDKYGIDVDNWGKINGYINPRQPETIDAWISCVFVLCQTNNPVLLFRPSVIQDMARKVVYALQIINPDAIRQSSDEAPNILCQVNNSVSFNEDGIPLIELGISTEKDDSVGRITLVDINEGFNNAGRTVTAPYELLNNARENLFHHDFRATVLNCATAIEIALKQKVSAYFASNHTAPELQSYLFKQADGYSKLVGLCKAMGISIVGLPGVDETVIKIRNKVIHGGYTPTNNEAKTAYMNTRSSMTTLGMPMFE